MKPEYIKFTGNDRKRRDTRAEGKYSGVKSEDRSYSLLYPNL